jgi:hypothetical protein
MPPGNSLAFKKTVVSSPVGFRSGEKGNQTTPEPQAEANEKVNSI